MTSKTPMTKQQLQTLTEKIHEMIREATGEHKGFTLMVVDPENIENAVYSANIDKETALLAYEKLFDRWNLEEQVMGGSELYLTEGKVH